MTIGRIPIIDLAPVPGDGFPAKAVVGEPLTVAATVFREGHDAYGADAVLTRPDGSRLPFARMTLLRPGTDRYAVEVVPDTTGTWTFHVEAWADPLETWRHAAEIKIGAGQDVELMFDEGVLVLQALAAQYAGRDDALAARVTDLVDRLQDRAATPADRLAAALDPELNAELDAAPLRDLVTSSATAELVVERERALYGSWYEFFPRSEGATLDPPRSGTFATAAQRLPAVAAMGFDVLYLPPVSPIGRTFRKGPNNTLDAGPDDPGVPWAVGSAEGGHDAIHPDLGTIEDFDAFVARANELGLEIALDYALQASPDHPWVTEHPEWFTSRADGSIAYAENPPKKYQDIYPLNFDNDPEGLYAEALRVLRHWMDHGVRIFRVDNPHTKPVAFWQWLISTVHETDPDVIFLAEAFTRPAMMRTLAAVGFTQSYTYFTWRTQKEEIADYLTELSTRTVDVLRPNFFVNTPDILHASLQYGGPPMFAIRATLAAMSSPSWGVYAGFELFEHVALRPGSEEYLNSEKYQYRPRDWAAAEAAGASLAPYVTQLNEIRRAHPALHRLRNLRLHATDSADVLAFSKSEGEDRILVVLTLDPHGPREATVALDMPELGADWHDTLEVTDLLSGASYRWSEYNYVRLDPWQQCAHIFSVRKAPA